MPIFQYNFYSGFKPRHRWNAEKNDIIRDPLKERADSWITIYMDLVYVAMFINLGHLLAGCVNLNGEPRVSYEREVTEMGIAIFLIMFSSRLAIDEYSNRFFVNDIFHRFLYFIYTFGLFVMTLNIIDTSPSGDARRSLRGAVIMKAEELDSHGRGLFAKIGSCPGNRTYWQGILVGFIGTRMALIGLYTAICVDNQSARTQFFTHVVRHSLSLIVAVITISEKHGKAGYIYAAAIIEMIFHMLPRILEVMIEMGCKVRRIKEIFPIDVYELQDRLGLFYMMVLGECMIQLLQSVYPTSLTKEVYLFCL